MANSPASFSRSINLSFKYIKEDINTLRLKASFLDSKIDDIKKTDSEIKENIKQLKKLISSSSFIKKEKSQKKPTEKNQTTENSEPKKGPELQFYDVKARKRFTSNIYREVVKNKTLFAVSKSPFGNYECYRILKKV